jgi:hypothetical protein
MKTAKHTWTKRKGRHVERAKNRAYSVQILSTQASGFIVLTEYKDTESPNY